MIDREPVWRFKSDRQLTQWYGHVQLLPSCAIGQWFCVDRQSGVLKWQHQHFRANSICGSDSGVIVAYEMRSDGPWTAGFGCYGLSLESGALIWASHGTGTIGKLSRLFDFIPGFTNGLRDSPSIVADGKVFCSSGRVLNVLSGKTVSQISPDEVRKMKPLPSDAWRLYDSSIGNSESNVSIGDLVLAHPSDGKHRGKWSIIAKTKEQDVAWRFDINQTGLHIDGNYYSYRLAIPNIYLILSDESRYKPHPVRPQTVVANPSRWHLLCLDVATGQVVQHVSLGDELLDECRIEDVDEHGLLVGKSSRELVYFRRSP